jgi:hypothetical protein
MLRSQFKNIEKEIVRTKILKEKKELMVEDWQILDQLSAR